ncbi:hypothetical protein KB206_01325 [Microvirga sp. STS02]|uniref:hypothetical protein n=1 Tax=Hymenobacter negativus TaxID=2795026 RepID=UPI0018DC7B68|nr:MULTISPECIES: hypothetical protein [Bacteria]MBH8567508.1 hypothetical protein [Hymenobacter negativus]MBR7207240.1 hypothetical protein [Microvirga sp. STS02]
MKKTLYPFLLVGLLAACQQQKPAATVPTATPPTTQPELVGEKAAPAETPLPALFTAADTLTQPMRDLLQTQDLSGLWHNNDGIDRDKPVFEGFFGPDHYHFAMAFTEVTRDPTNPAVYHVAGKCRYRKNIRPFGGTLTVRRIADLAYPGFLQAKSIQEERAADSVSGRTYTAHGQLQLREEQKENSGVFEGEIMLDFYTVPGQRPNFVTVYDHEGIENRLPTRGSGLLLRGNRRNVTTGQVKSFTVAPWVATVAPDVFKDFMLDERMGEINPKYAKLGWNEYWNNDEWWADSPKPSL